MQETILDLMFWEQVYTAFLCMMLIGASGLYISILPWKKQSLLDCHQEFLGLFSAKNQQVLNKRVQIAE